MTGHFGEKFLHYVFCLKNFLSLFAVIAVLSACGGTDSNNSTSNSTNTSNLPNSPGNLYLHAGSIGGSGNLDGHATDARFGGAMGVAVDHDGNVFVSDYIMHTIRKISPSQNVTTYAGLSGTYGFIDGDRGVARFNRPLDMTVDRENNLIIADQGNSAVRKIDTNGKVSTLLQRGDAGLEKPSGLSFDHNGNLYILNYNFSNFHDGSIILLSNQGVSRALLTLPNTDVFSSIAVDSAQNIYLGGRSVIKKISPQGAITTFMELSNLSPSDPAQSESSHVLAIDQNDNLYLDIAATVLKISPNGDISKIVKSAYVTDGILGISIDAKNNLYLADRVLTSVMKMDQAGTMSLYAGSPASLDNRSTDGKAEKARFNQPGSLTSDANGNLYLIDDQLENRGSLMDGHFVRKSTFTIRKVTSTGEASTLHQMSHDSFVKDSTNSKEATSLTLDTDGNFYFSMFEYCPGLINSVCNRIGVGLWKLDRAGYSSKLFTDDDFRFARNLVFDRRQNAYVINDGFGSTIWRIAPNGSRHPLANSGYKSNPFMGVAVNSQDVVYAIRRDTLFKIGVDGSLIPAIREGVGRGQLMEFGSAMTFDSSDNLYVSTGNRDSSSGFTILKITPDGVSTILLGDEQKRGITLGKAPASLDHVNGLQFVAPNLLYILSGNSVLKYILPQ